MAVRRAAALLLALALACAAAGGARAQEVVACVLHAESLADRDNARIGDGDDAYVRVSAHASRAHCRTATIPNSANPVWRECCELGVLGPSDDVVFDVFDVDVLQRDQAIGRATTAATGGERWLTLQALPGEVARNGLIGRLRVRIAIDVDAATALSDTQPTPLGAAGRTDEPPRVTPAPEPLGSDAASLSSLSVTRWDYRELELSPPFSPQVRHYTVVAPVSIDAVVVHAQGHRADQPALLDDTPLAAGAQALVRLDLDDAARETGARALIRVRAARAAPAYVVRVLWPHSPHPPPPSPSAPPPHEPEPAPPSAVGSAAKGDHTRTPPAEKPAAAVGSAASSSAPLSWLSVSDQARLSPELSPDVTVYHVLVGCDAESVSVHAIAADGTAEVRALAADGSALGSGAGELRVSWRIGSASGVAGSSPTLELWVAAPPDQPEAASAPVTLIASLPPPAECESWLSRLELSRASGGAALALSPAVGPHVTAYSLSAPVDEPILILQLGVSRTCIVRVGPELAAPGGLRAPAGEAGSGSGGGAAQGAYHSGAPLALRMTGPWDPPLQLSWALGPGTNLLRVELVDARDGVSLIRAYSLSAVRTELGASGATGSSRGAAGDAAGGAADDGLSWYVLLRWFAVVAGALLLCFLLVCVSARAVRLVAFAAASGWADGSRGEPLAARDASGRARAAEPKTELAHENGETRAAGRSARSSLVWCCRSRAATVEPIEEGTSAHAPPCSGVLEGLDSLFPDDGRVPCPRLLALLTICVVVAVIGALISRPHEDAPAFR